MKVSSFYSFIVVIVLVVFFTSCKNKTNETLTIMTYNIHHGLGEDGKIDLQRIANVIKAENPEIVALQEVDILTNRNGKVNQLEELGRLTNMKFVFGKSMNWDDGEYGNGVLTKLPIISHKIFPLPGEPRSALALKISLNNKEIVFISTHLDNIEEFRKNTLSHIDTIINTYKDFSLIIAGDFNAFPESDELKYLGKNLINATPNKNTIPVSIPDKQIDYIMYSNNTDWSVLSSKVVVEKTASDHRPLVAKIKI